MENHGKIRIVFGIGLLIMTVSAFSLCSGNTPASGKMGSYGQDALISLTGAAYTSVNAVAVGDCDNDGNNEIVANYDWYSSSGGTPKTVVLQKTGSAYAVEGEIGNFSMLLSPGFMCQGVFHIVVGDVDNDHDNEIVMSGKYNGNTGLYIFKAQGPGYVEFWHASKSGYTDAEVCDINNDSLNELIAPGLGVFHWNGTGMQKLCSLQSASGIRIGDFDGDGMNDVILSKGTLGIDVLKWLGGGLVSIGTADDTSGYILCGFGAGDSDGDGRAEAFVVEYHNKMVLWGWDGSTVKKEWEGIVGSSDNPVTAWVGDADNDGLAELFVGNGNYCYGISVIQYEYNGSGYEATWNSGSLNMYCHSIAVGDCDGDDYNELVAGTGSCGNVYVFSGVPQVPDVGWAFASCIVLAPSLAVIFKISQRRASGR